MKGSQTMNDSQSNTTWYNIQVRHIDKHIEKMRYNTDKDAIFAPALVCLFWVVDHTFEFALYLRVND